MTARSLDALDDIGAGRSAPDAVMRLYRQAFADFGSMALWNWHPLETPTIAQALAVAHSLRIEGNVQARALAAAIEAACRAAL